MAKSRRRRWQGKIVHAQAPFTKAQDAANAIKKLSHYPMDDTHVLAMSLSRFMYKTD